MTLCYRLLGECNAPPQTKYGLSFQILCGGEGFAKESKMPYAPKGKYVFDTLHLWVL